jgi:hypothetical protein
MFAEYVFLLLSGVEGQYMPIDAERYKQDPRTPQELAKAILDHVVTPREAEVPYSLTFREYLLMDYQAPHDIPALRKYGEGLVLTLKGMEEGAIPDQKVKGRLRHALLVIDAYKQERAEWRDDDAREAREMDGPHGNFHQRKAAESMETQMVAISNLKAIEKLVRTLSQKLGVSLVEPDRGK